MRWSAISSATWSPRVRSSREQLERLGAGAGAQDPVALAEAAPQVARDGGQHGGLVVDGDDRGAALAGRRFGRRARCSSRSALRHRECTVPHPWRAVLGSAASACYASGGCTPPQCETGTWTSNGRGRSHAHRGARRRGAPALAARGERERQRGRPPRGSPRSRSSSIATGICCAAAVPSPMPAAIPTQVEIRSEGTVEGYLQ